MKSLGGTILCSVLALGLVSCGNGVSPVGKTPFKAPILNDPKDLQNTIDIKGHINFGQSIVGHFSDQKPLIGYFLDANRQARLTIELQAAQGSNDDPVLLFYGPADPSGLFGENLAMDDDGRDGRNSLIQGLVLPADGIYLIVVTSYSGRDTGEYKLSLGCTGNCGEPPCPDLACDLYCPFGFMTDERGCPICKCKEQPDYCRTDQDCPEGFWCNPCPQGDDVVPMDPGSGEIDETIAGCGPPTCEPIHNDFCLSDDDCPEGFRCEQVWDDPARSCGCDEDGECDCVEIVRGKCVPVEQECFSDSDCPEGYHCEFQYMDREEMGCAGAGTDSDAEEDGCIPPPGTCMPDQLRCKDNNDCPPGMMCAWFDGGAVKDPETGEPDCYPGQDCGGEYGVCVPGGCACPEYYAPVCAITPWGEEKTYDNKCFAECDDARIVHEGECGGPKPECFSDQDCPPGFKCEVPYVDPDCVDEAGNVDDNCVGGDRKSDCIDENGDGVVDCFGPGVCVPAEVECRSNADCPPGFECRVDQDPWDLIDWGKVEELCNQNPDMCEELKQRCEQEPDYCLKLYCDLVDPAPCDVAMGRCVPADHYCNSDDDCPAGQHCEVFYAQEGNEPDETHACTMDADCARGQVCVEGMCAPGGDCEPEVCGDGLDNDCDGVVDEGCQEPLGVCVDDEGTCKQDSDCPEGFRCEIAPIWGEDDGDPDAPSREVCNGIDDDKDGEVDEGCVELSGRCVPVEQECETDDECPAGFFCALPPCIDAGIACNADSDCPEDLACIDGTCTGGNGEQEPCGPGICVPREDPRCIVTGCSGQVCASHEVQTDCVWRPEYECLKFSQCTILDNGTCGWLETEDYLKCLEEINNNETCTADAECAPGEYCMNGRCMEQDCVCPEYYDPVCGLVKTQDGREVEQTFGNLCKLRCANAELLHEGVCDQGDECGSDEDCPSGFRCNTCPPDPNCPECSNCGPPVCEFINGVKCTSDRECPEGMSCDAATGMCR